MKRERLQALVHFIYVFHKMSIAQVKHLPFMNILSLYRLKPKELAMLRHLTDDRPLKSIMDTYPEIKTKKAAYKVLDSIRGKLSEEIGRPVTRDYLFSLVGSLDILALYPEQ